jgi:hypothetical protein
LEVKMATQQNRYQTFRAWTEASNELERAIFPAPGGEDPDMRVKEALLAEVKRTKAAFRAAFVL